MTKRFLSKLLMLGACLATCVGLAFLITPKTATKSVVAQTQENAIKQVNLSLTESLVLKYYATVDESAVKENTTLAMRFTMNDTNGNPKTSIVESCGLDESSQYIFELKEIAPQLMAEEIDATLVLLDESDAIAEELASYNDYSVKKYLTSLLNSDDSSDELKLLVHATLNYGAASQAYLGKTNTITNDITFETDFSDFNNNESTNTPNPDNLAQNQTQFIGMGLWFDYVIIPYVYAYIVDTDLETVEFKLSSDVVLKPTLVDKRENGGIYRIELGTYNPLQFAKFQSIKLYTSKNSTPKQHMSVSLNDYFYDIYYSDNSTEESKNLALALYNYGVAAVAYNK